MSCLTDDEINSLLCLTYDIAQDSPDPSTQNGALLYDTANDEVLSTGINEFPRGLDVTQDMLERPLKYTYIEHAERNAIYNGIRTKQKYIPGGAIMFAAWAACADCARAITNSGIKALIRHADPNRDASRWAESIKIGDEIMRAGGVEIIDVERKLNAPAVLRSSEMYHP